MPDKVTESHSIRGVTYSGQVNTVAYTDSDRVRFTAKYEQRGDHECWFWTRPLQPSGYAMFHVSGVKSPQYAHRVAWQLANGQVIPDGYCVCHRCDQRNCVNPSHLFLGTHAQNMADAASKRRLNGPRPNGRKVTDAVVAEMRALVAAGALQKLIAERFGVTKAFVSMVVSGKRRAS